MKGRRLFSPIASILIVLLLGLGIFEFIKIRALHRQVYGVKGTALSFLETAAGDLQQGTRANAAGALVENSSGFFLATARITQPNHLDDSDAKFGMALQRAGEIILQGGNTLKNQEARKWIIALGKELSDKGATGFSSNTFVSKALSEFPSNLKK